MDFMSGRGWRHCQSGKSFDSPGQSRVQTLTEEVEQAFLQAPISGLVALVQDPLKHFEFEDLLCAHKYVMEHRLFSWIKVQEKGPCKQRKWLARFRKRWGAKLGVLRPRDDVPACSSKAEGRPESKAKNVYRHLIFWAAVWEGSAIRYGSAAPFLAPPGGSSSLLPCRLRHISSG